MPSERDKAKWWTGRTLTLRDLFIAISMGCVGFAILGYEMVVEDIEDGLLAGLVQMIGIFVLGGALGIIVSRLSIGVDLSRTRSFVAGGCLLVIVIFFVAGIILQFWAEM